MSQSEKGAVPDGEIMTRLVEGVEAIAASLKNIESKLNKWESEGLPPSYEFMASALRPHVVDFSRTS
ncbi:hypothetical protein QUC26_17585 [Pseudomonas asiatica]|uniref:hypothetical protein n=1 Tax=Pseudomonas asiatica TaxID=2219225 RepID=UPI0025A0F15F|nr:hypothetical protein [Pseudomonas asiatica]MDM9589567.1 hypothetical protein [Pseudomonas asiatica]WJM51678.1 hypothetical protein QUC26_17585 [Pseudomonas asiatica]